MLSSERERERGGREEGINLWGDSDDLCHPFKMSPYFESPKEQNGVALGYWVVGAGALSLPFLFAAIRFTKSRRTFKRRRTSF